MVFYMEGYKFSFVYQKHVVTVDLRRIVAINDPKDGESFFRVYFGNNAVWNVDVSQHKRLRDAWMAVKC